ncbi:MAG: ATP-binding protein, partial [Acetobacteraceae bacterium]
RAGRAFGRFERRRPDGRWVEIRREPLPDGGFVALFTDITERRRADQALAEARAAAEAANAAKSRFVAMVSHEIRTPLQALLTGLDLLDSNPVDAPVRAGMREAGIALRRLLADVLDVSRFEAGRLSLHPVAVDPRAPLGQALAMLAPRAAERGIRLAFTPDPGLPASILADPERLCQVVANLLSNAVKFADPGVVTVTAVSAEGVLRIAVTDPGPPIAPERRAQLFQPFARSDAQNDDGAGLGLVICRDLVTAMGGEIGHTVAPDGQGNVFWFTLPAPIPPLALPLPERLRILLAEDVAASRLVTATMLRREGHEVTEAGDGETAARAAAAGQFDLILMDLDLPALDGMAATRRIRALPGPAGAVPVIALSGHIGAEEQSAALAAGVTEILAKPAARAALLAALGRHAGRPEAGGVLSAPRLRELREILAPDALAQVAEECLAELAARLGRFRSALADGDATAAVSALHAMAGLAGGYGLAEYERVVRAAMAALRAGTPADPALLDAALHRAGREMRAWAGG